MQRNLKKQIQQHERRLTQHQGILYKQCKALRLELIQRLTAPQTLLMAVGMGFSWARMHKEQKYLMKTGLKKLKQASLLQLGFKLLRRLILG